MALKRERSWRELPIAGLRMLGMSCGEIGALTGLPPRVLARRIKEEPELGGAMDMEPQIAAGQAMEHLL